jgi:hypothetical protein
VNEENNEANNIKNRLTNEWGKVPDVARYYKVKQLNDLSRDKGCLFII